MTMPNTGAQGTAPVVGAVTPEIDPLDIRNLQIGGLGPLRRINAIVSQIPWEKKQGQSGRAYIVIKLLLTDMVIEQSVEPYLFPTYELQIPYNKNEGSKFGIFGKSLSAVLDLQYTPEQLNAKNPAYIKPADRANIKSIAGKRVWLVLCDGLEGRPTPPNLYNGGTKQEEPTPCWKVYKVDGIGEISLDVAAPASPGTITAPAQEAVATTTPNPTAPANALQQAMTLLDGKNAQQFQTAALADALVKADAQVMNSIGTPQGTEGSFLDTMVKSGMFTMDAQGVFHKVEQPAS